MHVLPVLSILPELARETSMVTWLRENEWLSEMRHSVEIRNITLIWRNSIDMK